MNEFKSLGEFVVAIKKTSEGYIDPRLKALELKLEQTQFTEDELIQIEIFAEKLLKGRL